MIYINFDQVILHLISKVANFFGIFHFSQWGKQLVTWFFYFWNFKNIVHNFKKGHMTMHLTRSHDCFTNNNKFYFLRNMFPRWNQSINQSDHYIWAMDKNRECDRGLFLLTCIWCTPSTNFIKICTWRTSYTCQQK